METAEDLVNEQRICSDFVEPFFHCQALKLPEYGIDRCLIRDSLLNPGIKGFAEVKGTSYLLGQLDQRLQRREQYENLVWLKYATKCDCYIITGWGDKKTYSVFTLTKVPRNPPIYSNDESGRTLRIPLSWFQSYTMHCDIAVPHHDYPTWLITS